MMDPTEAKVADGGTETVRGLLRQALAGRPEAQLSVAFAYFHADGVDQDHREAARWFRAAAEQGDARAQQMLGLLYRNADGVPRDYREAVLWLRKSADQEDGMAMFWLGISYYNGQGVMQDNARAIGCFRKAEAQLGHSSAAQLPHYWLGRMYSRGEGVLQDQTEARGWFRKAADHGMDSAAYQLGLMHLHAEGVDEDRLEAARWFRKAASLGHALAQEMLGRMFRYGDGVSEDSEEAAKWFRQAADQGEPDAQVELGSMYLDGDGVPQDHAKAAQWFRKAAEQDHPKAQLELGRMYAEGRGVRRDYAEAARWYKAAAGAGLDGRGRAPAATAPSTHTGGPKSRGLDRVAGMRELKALLRREVVEHVRNPERFRRYGLSLPNGILLYGPPGCGKTYIARLLAEELGHHFVEITPGDLASPYIHDTVKMIRAAFDQAAARAPAVMIIDELEAFVPPRGGLGGDSHYKAEEVNEFLAMLNGCAEKQVLVIAATNLPTNIDPAVMRTGRLDKHIYVGPPDAEARAEMLGLHLSGRPVARDLDLTMLATELEAYSASDIKFLVDQAARLALDREEEISLSSFRAAMAGITPSVPPDVADEYRAFEQRGGV